MISKANLISALALLAWGNVATSSLYNQQGNRYGQGVLLASAGSYGSPAPYLQSQRPASFVNIQLGGGSQSSGQYQAGSSLVDTYRQRAPTTVYSSGSPYWGNTASYAPRNTGYGSAGGSSHSSITWGAGNSNNYRGSSYGMPAPAAVYRPAPAPVYRPAPVQVYRPAPAPVYRPAPVQVYKPAPQLVTYQQPPRVVLVQRQQPQVTYVQRQQPQLTYVQRQQPQLTYVQRQQPQVTYVQRQQPQVTYVQEPLVGTYGQQPASRVVLASYGNMVADDY